MWFFAYVLKHRHIIYRLKVFLILSMDSRSLPQNKAPFASDQMTKFCRFAHKTVLTIQALSSWMEGTTVTRRMSLASWDQMCQPKLAGEWYIMLELAATLHALAILTTKLRFDGSSPFEILELAHVPVG